MIKRRPVSWLVVAIGLLVGTSAVQAQELDVRRIPHEGAGAEFYFSPDGKTLIGNAQLEGDETHYVYTMSVDTGEMVKINGKGEDACSHFYPDGDRLIWTSTRDHPDMPKGGYSEPNDYPQGAELYSSALDGSDVKRLTNNSVYDAEVGVSPDGKWILWSRQIDGEIDLWRMPADGTGEEEQITFTEGEQEGGAFYLPDSETVLYRSWHRSSQGQRGMPMTIYTINHDGTGKTQVTTEEGTNWAPYPAPDGEHFAFVKMLPPHNFEIFLRSLKTGKEQQLTFNSKFDGFPAISADGKMMTFSSGRQAAEGKRELHQYVMDISSLDIGPKNQSSSSMTPQPSDVRIVAGNGEAGFVDGNDARLNKPIRLSPFGPGKILIADFSNHAIRSVSIDGEVKTLAGGPDKKGHKDGPAAQAGFDGPHGVAAGPGGLIAVAGASSHTVRLLTPTDDGYEVTTLAGVVGQSGLNDGPAGEALFNSPHAVVWEEDGGLLVVDIGNASIRRVKDGTVSTVATAATGKFAMPIDMMPAGDGGYLIADAGMQKALRWSPGEEAIVLAAETEMGMPHGVSGDADGNIFVAEIRGHQVTELAGGVTARRIAGTGVAGAAPDQLDKPAGVLVHDGYVWIADLNNHRISVVPLKSKTAHWPK